MATLSGSPVRSIAPGLKSIQLPRSCTKLTRLSLPLNWPSLAPGIRYWLNDVVVGLEGGGVDIGDVVGDDVELVTERHLPRQADEKCILHRYSPL